MAIGKICRSTCWNRNQCRKNTWDWFKNQILRYNIQELSLSLKNLSQQLDVAHKMASEVEVQLSTSLYDQEIEDIIVLKNNKGTEDNRVRKLDYSIQLSELFYKRFIANEEITLFSPHNVPFYMRHLGHLSLMNSMRSMREQHQYQKQKSVQEN